MKFGVGAGITSVGVAGSIIGSSAVRVGGSMAGAFGAGELHRKFTRKGLEKKIKQSELDVKGEYISGIDFELEKGKDLSVSDPVVDGEKINARDRELLKKLRKAKKEGNLTEEGEKALKDIEAVRRKRAEELMAYREKAKEELQNRIEILRAKNEKRRLLVKAAGALLGGLSGAGVTEMAHGGSFITPFKRFFGTPLRIWNSIFEDGHQSLGVVNPHVTPESHLVNTEHFNIPEEAYTRRGDGITQILKRQFENNPELARQFGMEHATAKDYADLAERYGYLNDNYEVRLKLDPDAAYVPVKNADGDLVIREFKNGELFERHCDPTDFEGSNIDSNEYLEKRGFSSHEYIETPQKQDIFIADQAPTETQDIFPVGNSASSEVQDVTPIGTKVEPKKDIFYTQSVKPTPTETNTISTTKPTVEHQQPRHLTRERVVSYGRRRGGGRFWRALGNILGGFIQGNRDINYYGGHHYGHRISPASARDYYDNLYHGSGSSNSGSGTSNYGHNN
jgi:hypothetical protein